MGGMELSQIVKMVLFFLGTQDVQKNNHTLEKLNISGHLVDVKGIKGVLKKHPYLKQLNVVGRKIGPHEVSHFTHNKTIVKLNVFDNDLGPLGAEYLGKNTTILGLNIGSNNIGCKGFGYIVKNINLKILFAADNSIGLQGVKYLMANRTLDEINLSGNLMGNAGAYLLAVHPTIKKMTLSSNDIDDIAGVVRTVVLFNYAIEKIILDDTSPEQENALERVYRRNKTIHRHHFTGFRDEDLTFKFNEH